MGAKKGGGAGNRGSGDMFGCPLRDDLAASFSALRAKIDEMISLGEHIQMVLDDHDGVAGINEAVQEIDETADVGQVKTNGRLLEEKKMMGRTPGAALGPGLVGGDLGRGQFGHQFQALGFPSGKSRAGLAKLEVAQTRFREETARGGKAGLSGKELRGLFGGEMKGIVDRFFPIPDGENLLFPAVAVALLATNVRGWEEVHLDADRAGAVAGWATTWPGIMGKVGGGEAGLLGLRQGGVKGAEFIH